jgi:3-deoxy-D-manno-octulosonic-acid transferase
MILLYNLCQLVILAVAWPALIILVLGKAKYRKTFLSRLGIGLRHHLPAATDDRKTVWIHALSVGEVSSARPLVRGLREAFPELRIIVSTATSTGRQVAHTLLASHVNAIIASPLDFQPAVSGFLDAIRPDIFILVETDFWPNLLTALQKKNIPTILVNGRISAKSFTAYRRTAFFFRPLFQSFSHLCMQTMEDLGKMRGFGVDPGRLHCPGNLKYDTFLYNNVGHTDRFSWYIPDNSLVFLAGSTHAGEEDIIFSVCSELKKKYENLFLILAPRDPGRGREVGQLAAGHHLSCTYRSDQQAKAADLLILDSMGELPWLYALADIAFVGGSMVSRGGHNPIEPAGLGVPILFGRHMEDFSEISRDLVLAGGALEVTGQESLQTTLSCLLASKDQRQKIGNLARQCIKRQRGVVERHLEIIRPYL